jgi:hypothetical protein
MPYQLEGLANKYYGISYRDYLGMARFSNEVEDKLGILTVKVDRLEGLFRGACIELVSGGWSYHLRVESTGRMLLDRCDKHGNRQKLSEGSSAVQMHWQKLVDVMETCERSKVRA